MLQGRAIKRADLVAELSSSLSSASSHFFVDTSFLLAAASLNSLARSELSNWLSGLGVRFHVPVWVAHEVYGKISTALDVFTPMAAVAGDAIAALEALQAEARRYLDDERAHNFAGQPDRRGFLAGLDRETTAVVDRARFLKRATKAGEQAADFVVELVNRSVMTSDIYSGLPRLDAEYEARVIGGHPPGYLDKGKANRTRQGDNRYGDLIIWQEVVAFVRGQGLKSVVLLTNDNKSDWVFVPPIVIDDRGHPLNNDARKSFKIILPLPLLMHELQMASSGAKLTIANLGMVAQMLHQELRLDAANLFSAYQAFAGDAEVEAEEPTVEAPVEDMPAIPTKRRAPFEAILNGLHNREADAATSATAEARALLLVGLEPGQAPRLATAIVAAADLPIEAAALLIRDLVTGAVTLAGEARNSLLAAMFNALYYDENDRLRDKPLLGPLDDLFGVQTEAGLRAPLAELEKRLGPSRKFFLVTPDPARPVVSLAASIERTLSNDRRLIGLHHEGISLLEDVPRGSPRSLASIFDGAMNATASEFQRAIGRYFRAPVEQLDLGLSSFDRLTWDSLTGFIDWGSRRGVPLR